METARAMQRLQMIDQHAVKHSTKQSGPKAQPTSNVWESMGYDRKLSQRAIDMRKAIAKMMDDNIEQINQAYDEA